MTEENQKKDQKIAHPHDLGYRHLFSFVKLFRQLIEDWVDVEWKEHLDYDQAEKIQTTYVLPEFAKQESDVIYKVPLKTGGREIYLYILIEHQSTVDFSIPFRVFLYLAELWRDLYKNSDENERKTKDYRLPPVFPIVLYNGEGTWTAPRSLREMVEEGDLFGEYLPNVRYALVNICDLNDAEILEKKNALASVFLLEKRLGDEKLKEFWDAIWSFVKGEDSLLLEGIFQWLIMILKQRGIDTSEIGEIDWKTNLEEGKTVIQNQLDKIEKRGEKRGEKRNAQESILDALETCFGEVPEPLQEKITAITELEQLRTLHKKAILCTDLEDFGKEL